MTELRPRRQNSVLVGPLVRSSVLWQNHGNPNVLILAVMRLNEIIGIEQSRAWNVCTLNDFRRVSKFV